MAFRIIDYIVFSYYLPSIIFNIKNWVQFLQAYMWRYKWVIYFRNGLRLMVSDLHDASSLNVIFIKKEYWNIEPHSTILDIGSNRGYFSIYAAKMGGGCILAYEPIYSTYQSIVHNIGMNEYQKVITPFNVGVSGSDEVKEFFIHASITTSMVFKGDENTEIQKIPCVSLKNIIDSNKLLKIDLIKMDCEWAEYEIFYNTPRIYLDMIKEIRMEYHDSKNDKMNILELKKFMLKNNYRVRKQVATTDSLGIIWFQNIWF